MTNIILTGFMGTGKTTVGQIVAQRLNRPFVDMDAEIERRMGKAISRIFAEDGETAFRHIEAALCQYLGAGDNHVIATGGGALVNPANRAAMQPSGVLICLDATPEEIMRRVGRKGASRRALTSRQRRAPASRQGVSRHAPTRPLLDVADPTARITELLAARYDAYAAIPWHINTTGRDVDAVAAQILTLADTRTLSVQHPGGSYDIHIGHGLLTHLGSALRAAGTGDNTAIAIVTNTVVGPLYAAQVEAALQDAGYQSFTCTLPDGEQHKTLDTVRTLYEQFLDHRFDRSGTVLGLGGGVTGDIAGFAAATFMRGTRFAQVPTSLLAMTDASVGGKTGVDLPQGKNLVGAFKQPDVVLIDLDVLQTLPAVEFRVGMAEIIKHGVIGDAALFAEMQAAGGKQQAAGSSSLVSCILPPASLTRSIRVKIGVVEQDPFEHGRRAVLNLGHTSAHSLEQVSNFTLRHGEAVSIGLVVAARIAEAMEHAEPGLAEQFVEMLSHWGLPVAVPPVNVNVMWDAMTHDKKKRGQTLRWILPLAIGAVEIAEDVPEALVKQVLCEMGATNGE